MATPNFRLGKTIYGFQSVSARVNGMRITGLLSLDYEVGMERPLIYADDPAGRPVGIAPGKLSLPPMNLKMLHEDGLKLITMIGATGATCYGVAFSLAIQVIETKPLALPLLVTAPECYIVNKKASWAEGTEALAMEFQIQSLDILENGLSIWDKARALAGAV